MVYHTVNDVARASCEITHWHDVCYMISLAWWKAVVFPAQCVGDAMVCGGASDMI